MYDVTIGLEIHVQQKTKSKMFCRCSNAGELAPPNTTVCPICLGHPGTMPVLNGQAVEWGVKMALALQCTINEYSKFDRKNYFYPDLPKGYQISQYDQPVGVNGHVTIQIPSKEALRPEAIIRINRLHLEEDAAKLQHVNDGKDSLVDFNRGGTPLMEIVTEPDFKTAEEAKIFLQELRLLARYLGVSDADMEKGHLRCDANVSVQFDYQGLPVTTPISEIKNLNSFRAVERALIYEAERLHRDWMSGGETATRKGKITVGWDDAKGQTIMQRGKEDAHDYRYFPEPDLPPLHFTAKDIEAIRSTIPELPNARKTRFTTEYGITPDDAKILVEDQRMSEYFEQSASELGAWMDGEDKKDDEKLKKNYRLLAGWLINKLSSLLSARGESLLECKISPENFAELICIIAKGTINSSTGQVVLEEMLNTGAEPDHIIADKNLEQISDSGSLESVVDQVIAASPEAVANYKAGKTNAVMFMVGQIMKVTKGKAQPEVVKNLIEKKLAV